MKVNSWSSHNVDDIANVFNAFITTVAANRIEKVPPPPNVFYATSTVFQQFYSRAISDAIHVDIYPISQNFLFKELSHRK
jgi:hypothetical protein